MEDTNDRYGIMFELIRDDDGNWDGEMVVQAIIPDEQYQEKSDNHQALLNRIRLMCASVNAMTTDPVVYAALSYQVAKEFANSFNADHFEYDDSSSEEQQQEEEDYEQGNLLTRWTKTEGEA